ncbi:hypothetical protein B296_00014189, partial [Ensete ventricosum]
EGFCSVPPSVVAESISKPLYWKVTNPTLSPSNLQGLELLDKLLGMNSKVNTLGAYLITPAIGAHFSMYLAKMQENSRSGLPPKDVERFHLLVFEVRKLLPTSAPYDFNVHVSYYKQLLYQLLHN